MGRDYLGIHSASPSLKRLYHSRGCAFIWCSQNGVIVTWTRDGNRGSDLMPGVDAKTIREGSFHAQNIAKEFEKTLGFVAK
jgi:hypothetical protein